MDDEDSDISSTDAVIWYADSDGDSYGDADSSTLSCSTPTGYVLNDTDCNEQSAGNCGESAPSPEVIWQNDFPEIEGAIEATPSIDNQRNIYVSFNREAGGTICKVHFVDGEIIWCQDVLYSPMAGSPIVTGGMVYVVTTQGFVYALEGGGMAPNPHKGWWARRAANNMSNSQVFFNAN